MNTSGDSNHSKLDHLEPDALRGRALRFILVDLLRQHPVVTVADMVTYLDELGYQLPGRASKVISDALRWEQARGRVIRLGRGIYRYGRTPTTTARRITIFAARCHAWLRTTQRGNQPPPTPPDQRRTPWLPPLDPTRPPWEHLGWLWTT